MDNTIQIGRYACRAHERIEYNTVELLSFGPCIAHKRGRTVLHGTVSASFGEG